MWAYFDEKGQLITSLEHGSVARAGTTSFQIFAFFKDVDILTTYSTATIKLRKPDLYGNGYPLLLMSRDRKVFHRLPSEANTDVSPFIPGQAYTGYIFDFADFNTTEETEVLLDTPGLWEATITLVGANRELNVQGVITFNVAEGTSSEDSTEMSIDEVLNQIYTSMGTKLDIASDFYLRVLSQEQIDNIDFTSSMFNIGDIIFNKTDKKFYQLDGTLPYNVGLIEIQLDLGDVLNALSNLSLSDSGYIKVENGEIILKDFSDDFVPYTGATKNVVLGKDLNFSVGDFDDTKHQGAILGNVGLGVFSDLNNSTIYRQNEIRQNVNGTICTLTIPNENGTLATKEWTTQQIDNVLTDSYSVVDVNEYPTLNDFLQNYTGREGFIYLYPIDTADPNSGYYRYIYENNNWLSLGTTEIDLIDYARTDDNNIFLFPQFFWEGIAIGDNGNYQAELNIKFRDGNPHFVIDALGGPFLELYHDETSIVGTLYPNRDTGSYRDLGLYDHRWHNIYFDGVLSDATNSISVVNIENKQNKVTSLSSNSNDTEYPSAKAVYDNLVNVREVAEGKCKTYVLSYQATAPTTDAQARLLKMPDGNHFESYGDFLGYVGDDVEVVFGNPLFENQNLSFDATDYMYIITDDQIVYNWNDIYNFKTGDIILVAETVDSNGDTLPDRWWFKDNLQFMALETTKVNLTNYPTLNGLNTFQSVQIFNNIVQFTSDDTIISHDVFQNANGALTIKRGSNSAIDLYDGSLYVYDRDILPRGGNTTKSLGSDAAKWKDIYLSNSIVFGSNQISSDSDSNLYFGVSSAYDNIFNSRIYPNANGSYDVGASSKKWRNVYMTGNIKGAATMTQAQYDALVSGGTVDADTFYFIEEE